MKKDVAHVAWLYDQIPILVEKGILSQETAAKLKGHYGQVAPINRAQLALSIFTVIGVICIGLGIILIFAYNWDQLTRLQKVGLSLLPLILSLAFMAKTLFRSDSTVGAREGCAIFNILAVGAAIALVSQAYHLPGDLEGFLFVWMLITSPVMYLLGSSVSCLIYLMGMAWWAITAQNYGGHALLYWPVTMLAAPFLVKRMRELKSSPFSLRTHWLLWGVCICFSISLGVSIEKVVPGSWILIYSAFFAVMYMAGTMYADKDRAGANLPFRRYGLLALVVLSYMLTFRHWWKDIGWAYARSGGRYHEWAVIVEYLLLLILLPLSAILLMRFMRRDDKSEAAFGFLPVLSLIFFALDSYFDTDLIATGFFNMYLLMLSLLAIRKGIRDTRLVWLNAGLVMIAILIWTRFLDFSIGILGRAAVFIFFGVCFLIANRVLSKKAEA